MNIDELVCQYAISVDGPSYPELVYSAISEASVEIHYVDESVHEL